MSHSRTFKAAILASGEFLSTLVNLASFAVLSRVLTMGDYATYRQAILAFFFAVPILTLGLPQAMYYFLPGEQKRPRAVLLENMIPLTLMAVLFSAFLLFGGGRLLAMRFSNPGLERMLLLFAPYPLLILPAAGLAACLMARDRARQVAIYNVASRLVTGLLVIAAAILWRNPEGPIRANVLAAAVILVPAIWLMLRATRGGERSAPTLGGMWEQSKFAVPLGLAAVLGTVSASLDKVIVASMCSRQDFAIYSNGAMEIPLIGVVTGSITAVLLPDIARLRKEGRSAEALELWKRGAAKSAVLILPVMCLLFCMAPEVMSVLFSSRYLASALPFRLYLLLLPIRVVTFAVMLLAANKGNLLLIRAAGDLVVNLLLSVVFVRFWGYIGAAIAGIITMYLWTVPFSIMAIARHYGTRPVLVMPLNRLWPVLAASILACIACIPVWLFPGLGVIARVIIATLSYVPCAICILLAFRCIDLADLRRALTQVITAAPGRRHLGM